MKTFQSWLEGIISAIMGGALSSLGAIGFAPETFNFDDGLNKTFAIAGMGAIIGLMNFLKQSPLPKKEP